jgi:septal ring factor EnvC (AmiA/AmiB activator)
MSESRISTICLIILFLFSFNLYGQKSRDELEKEKKETLRKIEEAQKILAETASEKQVSIGQLNAVNKQIEARENLIRSINNEINLINDEIGEVGQVINALESDLVDLKKEYARMVYLAHKAGAGYNRLTFIFSAETFNQLFMRLKYIRQYGESRKNQVKQIEQVKETLQNQKLTLETKNEEKLQLREQEIIENKNLLAIKSRRNQILNDLKSREKDLKQEIVDRRKAVDKLENMIAELVRLEIEKANVNKNAVTIADAAQVTDLFERNKTKLDWPVTSGFVSSPFGVHPHPVYKGILEKNDGINIQTNKDEVVKAVFDGVVSKIAILPPPFNEVVLVKHGEYITVYGKLREVFVKSGQTIRKGERIGKVFTDKNGISEVHFMVWKNNQKLDPETWLVHK